MPTGARVGEMAPLLLFAAPLLRRLRLLVETAQAVGEQVAVPGIGPEINGLLIKSNLQ
jgi:hypothetical protein